MLDETEWKNDSDRRDGIWLLLQKQINDDLSNHWIYMCEKNLMLMKNQELTADQNAENEELGQYKHQEDKLLWPPPIYIPDVLNIKNISIYKEIKYFS